MSEQKLTTEEVRNRFADGSEESAVAFDQWLANHTATALRGAAETIEKVANKPSMIELENRYGAYYTGLRDAYHRDAERLREQADQLADVRRVFATAPAETLREYNEQVHAERDGLAVIVERVRVKMNQLVPRDDLPSAQAAFFAVLNELSASPVDALREHDAEVWDAGYIIGAGDVCNDTDTPNPYGEEKHG